MQAPLLNTRKVDTHCEWGYLERVSAKLKSEQIPGIFVTGTDTGVGKTLVAGAIAKLLSQSGRIVGVFKPIATGCDSRREGLVSSDAEFLAHCSDCRHPLNDINPVRYREPLAPSVAAERSGRGIDFQEIQAAYHSLSADCDVLVVEGIGGALVPISPDYMLADLAAEMALPVVIVARSTLGTINHTLLTIEAFKSRSVRVAGIVVNGYPADGSTLAEETNPRVIAEISGKNVLTVIPYDNGSCVETGQLGEDVLTAAGLVNWLEVIRGS